MSAISVEGFGSVTWWGFTPALDLTSIAKDGYAKRTVEASLEGVTMESDHLNILLVGSGDLRHILTSLANTSCHTSKPIHFYVAESCLEVFARHMLFLTLLFEPTDKLGLQEKAELFLELFGNSLVRAQTADYLRQKANDLIKMVTDLEYLRGCIPMLDISGMKFKERDMLEGIFKFWRHPDESTFDIRRHCMVHHLTSGIESVMGPNCTLVLETARYMLDLKKEQREQFVKKVTGMAAALGFKNALHLNEDGDYLAFIRDSSS